jgi:hypothetical protein
MPDDEIREKMTDAAECDSTACDGLMIRYHLRNLNLQRAPR